MTCFPRVMAITAVAVAAVLLGRPVLKAEVDLAVDGTGWWQDRKIERAIRSLTETEKHDVLDANAVEDAVFFAMSAVAAQGYLRASVQAEIGLESGQELEHAFDPDFRNLLPRPMRATRVRLIVDPGVRYRFENVEVIGVQDLLDDTTARELIVPKAGLLMMAGERLYTPEKLRAGVAQIELKLRERGYAEAVGRVTRESRNDETGAVDVTVEVAPGPIWRVMSVDVVSPVEGVEVPSGGAAVGRVWTSGLQQDLVEALRRAYFKAGYPDVRVQAKREGSAETKGEVDATIRITAEPGLQVTTGTVRFEGNVELAEGVLRRRVMLKQGALLNPLLAEESRRRLGRLRAISGVDVTFDPRDGQTRDPVFSLTAREPWESSLLFGYGSYEQVRGGVELRGTNLMRRSHQLRLEAIGSLKSLRGDLVYTVPDLFGETVDANLRLFGLDRQELSFQRQEYGATLGLTRRGLPWVEADGTIGYTFQDLRNSDSDLATRSTDITELTSASLTLGLSRDSRDNPLLPRSGLRWFAQAEVADPRLGGEVGFQRFELGGSWHRAVSRRSWIHLGFTHGTVLTMGEQNDLGLPTNKRFFPGGENSLRGMNTGEASPRNAVGEFIGAKSFTLLNVEFEQALTRRISAVVFWDALGMTAELENGLWADVLHTVGGGVRYQTLIGPLRVEYGHNLNPRPLDPSGTLHFSLGFPF